MTVLDTLPPRAPADSATRREWIGKTAYAMLFTLVLPAALVAWAGRLDQRIGLPAYGSGPVGVVVLTLGLALMAVATAALWRHGGGLPMSAYPPARFVVSGVYRYLSNPIYVGAVLVSAGAALAARSAAGLWIVTPVLAAAAAAWVLGYERDATRRRFANSILPPLVHLPPSTETAPTSWDRWSAYALVFAPWLLLYQAVELLGVPPDAVMAWRSWDSGLPVVPWMEIVYAAVYPFVLAVPIVAATRADLRRFMVESWVAIAITIPVYLLVPVIAPAKPVTGDGLLQTLMRWERLYDTPVTAFPAFHVVWTSIAVAVYRHRWPRLTALWRAITPIVAVSCVAVGMHAIADVLSAFVALVVVVNRAALWTWLLERTERLANSWSEKTFGPVRLLGHGVYAGAGAWLGTLIAVSLAGTEHLAPVLILASIAILTAGLWAQLVEGSPQLLRPYGYFGSVFGMLAISAVGGLIGYEVWPPLVALAIGGAVTQALGRGRCLVQGCCHGAECAEPLGIRYTHPRSRVTRLTALGGRPLYPTPLYSAVWMLIVAAMLFRLWTLGVGLPFIAGMYLILTGLGRFVEERYRGEPQTQVWRGLDLYQWLAIAFVIAGAWITTLGWTPPPPPSRLDSGAVLWTAAFGAATYAAYGLDFPRLNRRFSRLV